jgi:hypothetical protein
MVAQQHFLFDTQVNTLVVVVCFRITFISFILFVIVYVVNIVYV